MQKQYVFTEKEYKEIKVKIEEYDVLYNKYLNMQEKVRLISQEKRALEVKLKHMKEALSEQVETIVEDYMGKMKDGSG